MKYATQNMPNIVSLEMQTIILAYRNTMGLNLSVVTGCGNKSINKWRLQHCFVQKQVLFKVLYISLLKDI